MTGLRPDEVPAALRDANQIAELLKDRIVDGSLESVKLGS